MQIILCCLYNFQDYIITCIEQLRRLGHKNIHVLTNSYLIDFFAEIKENINIVIVDDFKESREIYDIHYSARDNSFRNKYWAATSMRFYYIYEFMKRVLLKQPAPDTCCVCGFWCE
jgi:hypothetical protein